MKRVATTIGIFEVSTLFSTERKAIPVKRTDKETLQGIISAYVKAGSTVYSDDNSAYVGLGTRKEFHHGTVKHSVAKFVNGLAHTNGIESVWAALKRGYNGIVHHMSAKYLQRYVDKFAFRLNDGNGQVDAVYRCQSFFRATGDKKMTCKELIK